MLTKECFELAKSASSRLSWTPICGAILGRIGYDFETDCAHFEAAVKGAALNFLRRNISRIRSVKDAERKLEDPHEAERHELTRWFLIVLGREICRDTCSKAYAKASQSVIARIDVQLRSRIASDPSTVLEATWTEDPDLILHRLAAIALAHEQGQSRSTSVTSEASQGSLKASSADA